MEKHVSIIRSSALPTGLNYDALRLLGIKYAQELSGDIWTDYNEHDPGVTLLEHLCYALTDLSYRAGFDIEDVLFAQEDPNSPKVNNGFFPPVDIYPTTPLTPTDYRRLLIDRIRGIRNAWFYPVESHNRGYRGLFRIRIQLAEGISDKQRSEEIVEEVRSLIMANRNLCEDLHEIVVLNMEYLSLSASISIEGDAFGEKVLASILHTVEQLLNPGIRYYSREELEAEGYAVEDIFDGPEPLHGFIKPDDLRPLPENTHVSTIREAIAKVEGVKLIDNLIVWKNGQRIPGDDIIPSPNSALSLDPKLLDGDNQDFGVQLMRNGVPISINPRQTRQFLNTLSAKAKKGFQTKLDLEKKKVVSRKSRKDLSVYRSFQRLLPAIYGLGADGLPASANRERRAKAYQLKAYLLIFEQFMADYLAQLAHVRDLFSISPQGAEDTRLDGHALTYFTQFPEDIPHAEHLFHHGLPKEKSRTEIIAKINKDLQKLSASFDPQDLRRNRFLDHLLARFGEVYTGDALRFVENSSKEDLEDALVQGKTQFLSNYPELSRDRSKGFNYTEPAWETENVSGLKKRVMLSLNISGQASNEEGKSFPKYTNHSLTPTRFMGDTELSPIRKPSREDAPPRLSFLTMIRDGIKKGNYEIMSEGREHVLYFQEKEEDRQLQIDPDTDSGGAAGANKGSEARKRLFSGTFQQCLDVRTRLIERFSKISTHGEGLFFLENILLRPNKQPGAILVFECQSPDLDNPIELRTLAYTDEKNLSTLSSDLLIIATHEANWSVLELEGAWRAILTDNGRVIMLTTPYLRKDHAEIAKDRLLDLCLTIRNNDPSSINNYLRLETENLPGFEVGADFYSLRLSIVAPAWPAMFQNPDFRQLFHQTIATNVPAHLSVDYYWLTPAEMIQFEGIYQHWLQAKELGDIEKAIRYALDIIRLLRPDLLEKSRPESNKNSLNDQLPASLILELGEAFGYSFIFSRTDFTFLQHLPEQVAEILHDLGIRNWVDLRRADPGNLVQDIIEAGLPASSLLVKNWQKQAALASANRWKDLLRYQRKAAKSGNLSTQQINKEAKVERALLQELRDPLRMIPHLKQWANKLPSDQKIPYPVINYLIESVGYGFLLPKTDLRIFSCISQEDEIALNKRDIRDWQGLVKMKARTWNGVLRDRNEENESIDLEHLKKEAQYALEGKWQDLIKYQTPVSADQSATAFTQRVAFHVQQLMLPVSNRSRLLVRRLDEWEPEQERYEVPKQAYRKLLKIINYGDLLSNDNFLIFEGIGPKVAGALKEKGISRWNQLAARTPTRLTHQLNDLLNPASLRDAAKWIEQAKLADAGDWNALIEWQKGPIDAASTRPDERTAMEARIDAWLEQNAQTTASNPSA